MNLIKRILNFKGLVKAKEKLFKDKLLKRFNIFNKEKGEKVYVAFITLLQRKHKSKSKNELITANIQEGTDNIVKSNGTEEVLMLNLTDYSALKGRRILVIADSPMNRYIAKTYLEEVGCIVREAESITDALEKLVSKGYGHLYDAILTDDQVHGMTAFEFLDAVKGIFSIKNIPIIIMVSVIGSISLQHSIIKGFDGYITKPYRRNDFLDGVARLFDEKQVDITQEREVGIQQSSNNNSIKILLVEDNEINRDFFVQLLTRIGLSCDVAVNGEEAVKAYKNDNNYDIIFMDCELPVMNGYEATSRIREEEEGKKRTVIIAVTGNAMKDDMERCLIAGMDDYISKPFNVEQVLKKIQKYQNTI